MIAQRLEGNFKQSRRPLFGRAITQARAKRGRLPARGTWLFVPSRARNQKPEDTRTGPTVRGGGEPASERGEIIVPVERGALGSVRLRDLLSSRSVCVALVAALGVSRRCEELIYCSAGSVYHEFWRWILWFDLVRQMASRERPVSAGWTPLLYTPTIPSELSKLLNRLCPCPCHC